MLRKLLKYEWKNTGKMSLLMLAALGVVTLLGVIGFVLPVSSLTGRGSYADDSTWGTLISVIVAMSTLMVYILILFGVTYGMLIYMGVHFYKTMYSDEGYLTHTLPVTPAQLIISKVLNGGIWYGLVVILIGVSVLVLVVAMLISLSGTANFAKEAEALWRELFFVFRDNLSGQMIHIMVSFLLIMLITPFSTMMSLLAAITIGQLASKYRAFMGILAYFGICVANGMVSYIASIIGSFGNRVVSGMNEAIGMNKVSNLTLTYDTSVITTIVMSVLLYFVTHMILTKKLNME